jgi:hypothetical protein
VPVQYPSNPWVPSCLRSLLLLEPCMHAAMLVFPFCRSVSGGPGAAPLFLVDRLGKLLCVRWASNRRAFRGRPPCQAEEGMSHPQPQSFVAVKMGGVGALTRPGSFAA